MIGYILLGIVFIIIFILSQKESKELDRKMNLTKEELEKELES